MGLLTDAGSGIRLNEKIGDVDGAVVFRQAMRHGAEVDRRQRARQPLPLGGRREWIKIKNPAYPAIERAMLIALSKRRR